MANDNTGLLIAALVAIVAVVGLVILFNSAATGAYGNYGSQSQTGVCACPDGYQSQFAGGGAPLGYCRCHKLAVEPAWEQGW